MPTVTLSPDELKRLSEEEEELRKKREKEKKNAVAYYVQVKYEQLKLKQDLGRQKMILESLVSALSLQQKLALPKLLPGYLFASMASEKAVEKRKSFFSIDYSKPENAELQEDLKMIDMTEDQFATLAFCACGKDIDKFVEKFNSEAEDEMVLGAGGQIYPREQNEAVDYDRIRDEGVLKARAAISEYRNGEPKAYARILGDALLLSCTCFSREPSDDVAMQWSLYTDEILRMFVAKKELVKFCGLEKKHFEIAEKVAMMGRTINGGLKAAEKIGQIQFNDSGELTNAEQMAEISGYVLKFQTVAKIRANIADDIMKLYEEPAKQVNTAGCI